MTKYVSFWTLTLFFIAGCAGNHEGHDHTDGDHDGHDHGPASAAEKLQPITHTLYSEKTELFIEFQPLIAGEEVRIAAHFTVLGRKFKPLTEGSVTLTLKAGGKESVCSADKPNAPGIYQLALVPKVPGKGTLKFEIRTKQFVDAFTIETVTVFSDFKSAFLQEPEPAAEPEVVFLKEQAWKTDFANTVAVRQPMGDIIKATGRILPAPGDEILLTAKSRGMVLFAGNQTLVGSEVKVGTVLFTISSGDFAEGNSDAAYKTAQANLDKTKTEFNRASALVKDHIISEKEHLQTKLDYEQAKIVFAALAKNHSAGGQVVTAPANGYVKNILVTEGQYVEPGTPLAQLSKNKKLILQASVSQKYFGKLPAIKSALFKTSESDSVYSTETMKGRVVSYGRSAGSHDAFIPISFELDNVGKLIPGSMAEVYLKTEPIADALVIPTSSLLEVQGSFFVYVQMSGEGFEKREVQTGATDGLVVQLLSGVAEGERVVSEGAYRIKLATASGVMPAHGHEH